MKTVLVLEEDREAGEALAKVMKKNGLWVILVGSEERALKEIASGISPNLVIAGITGRDRTEFLADLRGLRPRLPVIFLSDYCDPEARLRGLRFGACALSRELNFYINVRPVRLNELEQLISFALQQNTGGRLFSAAAMAA